MEHRLQGYAKMMIWLLGVIVLLWFLSLIVDQIQSLRDLDAYFMNHPGLTLLLNTTLVGMIFLGGLLLFLAQKIPAPRRPAIEYAETPQAVVREGSGRARPLPVLLVLMLGSLLMLAGIFGFLFVIGPPLVKIICAGAFVYGLVRTFRMFQKG